MGIIVAVCVSCAFSAWTLLVGCRVSNGKQPAKLPQVTTKLVIPEETIGGTWPRLTRGSTVKQSQDSRVCLLMMSVGRVVSD